MPYNGTGVFTLLYNFVNDAAAGIKIRADRFNNELTGIANGLSNAITKDGQTTVVDDLPMAGYTHTNVGAGTLRTQYTRLDQTQDGKVNWVDGGGTADAITATYSPAITTLVDGQECYVRATAANATTTPTFSPNALTARTIVKNGNVALAAGDIAGDGHELHFRYRLSDTKWELLNPAVTGVAILAANNTFSGTNTFTGKIVYPDDGELTIASGAITPTGVYHTVDTEGNAATDDLDTINGGTDGQILILRTEDDARDVVITSAGNISNGGAANITLSNSNDVIVLVYDLAKTKWLVQSATSAQGAKADTAAQITLRTPVATTSGTSIDFTSIPTGVKKITVGLAGVSTNGTSPLVLLFGNGTVETSGYSGDTLQSSSGSGAITFNNNAASANTNITGTSIVAGDTYSGVITFMLVDSSTNTWAISGVIGSSGGYLASVGLSKSLTNSLTILRLTTAGGANTFDAGKVNIMYEV